MTLQEAIEYEHEQINNCTECALQDESNQAFWFHKAEIHRQYSEWFEELLRYKELKYKSREFKNGEIENGRKVLD